MPFGEELYIGYGNRQVGHGYTYGDSTRQKFTGYERDEETDLDFAQARMHNYNHGRFTSPDPLYFQFIMVLDPQFFNLFTYARNNPLKFIDLLGESVRFRGQNTVSSIYEMAGGQEEFDKYFTVEGDRVFLREGVDLSEANEGVQNLAGLVDSSNLFLFYNGNDFNEIQDLFEGATKKTKGGKTKITKRGEKLKKIFTGRQNSNAKNPGYLVSVRGRPSHSERQPGSIDGVPIFSIVALNSDIPLIQTGINLSNTTFGEGAIAFSEQTNGLGQRVSAASFFTHEAAEAQTFTRIGFRNRINGERNYRRAHEEAMRIEARIRQSINLIGGFSGGHLGLGDQ